MAVVTIVVICLFVASVVDRVGNGALNGLGKDLLDLLGNDGGVTAVLGVCLGCGLVGLSAGGVDLRAVSSSVQCFKAQWVSIPYRGEPPQDQRERPPGPFRGRQSRRLRGTCPVRTRWWKTF